MTTIKEAPQLGIFKIFTYKTNRLDKSCQADTKLSTNCYQAARNIKFNQCEMMRQSGYYLQGREMIKRSVNDCFPPESL